jgi:CBS domain-containing membrane protein
MIKKLLKRMKGGDATPKIIPLKKMVVSFVGAFIGIYFISINLTDSSFLIGSFGASAVLIYGAPHVEYAQPRNLIGGHIISAVVGVTVYQYFPFDLALMAAFAVSLAIVAMHLTGTLHPPGGATALIAVIGGAQVHSAGYDYVFMPVALGAFIMLVVALIVNNLSDDKSRHYPKRWL